MSWTPAHPGRPAPLNPAGPHQELAGGVDELPEVHGSPLLEVLLQGGGQLLAPQVGAAHAQGEPAGLWGMWVSPLVHEPGPHPGPLL